MPGHPLFALRLVRLHTSSSPTGFHCSSPLQVHLISLHHTIRGHPSLLGSRPAGSPNSLSPASTSLLHIEQFKPEASPVYGWSCPTSQATVCPGHSPEDRNTQSVGQPMSNSHHLQPEDRHQRSNTSTSKMTITCNSRSPVPTRHQHSTRIQPLQSSP